jgi:hypothetical protein
LRAEADTLAAAVLTLYKPGAAYGTGCTVTASRLLTRN